MEEIKLDLTAKNTVLPRLFAKQGDVGRKFRAVITDNGKTYQIPADALLSVWYSGTSGEGNYSTIGENSAFSIDGNTVTVELITQMLTNPGDGNVCLVMNLRDGTQIGTWNIPYIVEQLPGMGSSVAEQYFTALSEVAGKAAESAAKAAEAAATFDTDTSLSVAGKAADAEATGAALDGKASLLQVYPVGAIYISTVSASPASLFGGTWEQLKDRFLLGAGGSYAAGAMGGAASITHRHEASGGITGGYAYFDIKDGTKNITVSSGQGGAVSLNTTSVTTVVRSYTSEESFNNMPPYLAVYMWKRVA